MRYVTQADADPNASSARMAREFFAHGAGSFRAESDTTSTAANAPIRIFTLGRFSIAIDEHAVRASGKAKHRPLGLLKALIALGGRDVAFSRLCECLWPDSEGDLGARNLSITVHRLRSLLDDAALRSRLGNALAAEVRSHYDIRVTHARYASMYRELVRT